MDAHLIGIDLVRLVMKQNARLEKQAPVRVKSAVEPGKGSRAESR